MPIYDFYNTETDEVIENKIMTIASMEQYLKDNPHIRGHYTTVPGIVSGAGSRGSIENIDNHGFKEVLQRVGEAHPMGSVADQHTRKTGKEVATRDTIKKHAKIQANRVKRGPQ
ncbi:hypothetical protein N9159_00435 [bacterium]|jgi:hypothetical protein|nr:hypothetical protein [bacterium]|tara:strand:+ start:335 stop:676 length:342 start_codon:yes stop_codon:yes gene_type:complete